jgi:hypothetical protein
MLNKLLQERTMSRDPTIINDLQQSNGQGGTKLYDVAPNLISGVIEDRLWAGQCDRQGVPFTSFEAFVTHRLWWGLESTVDDLLSFCKKRPDVQRLIRGEVAKVAAHGEIGGGHSRGDIVTSAQSVRGNQATYALRRLKRARPARRRSQEREGERSTL